MVPVMLALASWCAAPSHDGARAGLCFPRPSGGHATLILIFLREFTLPHVPPGASRWRYLSGDSPAFSYFSSDRPERLPRLAPPSPASRHHDFTFLPPLRLLSTPPASDTPRVRRARPRRGRSRGNRSGLRLPRTARPTRGTYHQALCVFTPTMALSRDVAKRMEDAAAPSRFVFRLDGPKRRQAAPPLPPSAFFFRVMSRTCRGLHEHVRGREDALHRFPPLPGPLPARSSRGEGETNARRVFFAGARSSPSPHDEGVGRGPGRGVTRFHPPRDAPPGPGILWISDFGFLFRFRISGFGFCLRFPSRTFVSHPLTRMRPVTFLPSSSMSSASPRGGTAGLSGRRPSIAPALLGDGGWVLLAQAARSPRHWARNSHFLPWRGSPCLSLFAGLGTATNCLSVEKRKSTLGLFS